MIEKQDPFEEVKNSIRVILVLPPKEKQTEHFDYFREDGYRTNIDCGFEDLSLKEDMAKIMLYMQNDTLVFNKERLYKVIKREFMPCVPVVLYLYVEEIK